MKQDYLWDKTGSDPDIERLEGLLAGFRHRDEAASDSNVVPFPITSRRSMQPWLYALAACITIAAVSLGIWSISIAGEEQGNPQIAHVNNDPAKADAPPAPAIAEPENIISAPEPAELRAKLQPSAKRRSGSIALKKRDHRDTPLLTKEEKYAYGQLMLALAITSSKLQLVQDTINGVEDNKVNDR